MANNRIYRRGNRIIIVGQVVLLLVYSSFGQAIEAGWRGIKPLVTNKASVQKILGKPDVIDDNNYYGYKTSDAFIQINYSTSPCLANQYNRGRFDIPSDTVINYDVHLKKLLKLTDLIFDRAKYYKDTSGDLLSSWTYYDQNAGIGITAGFLDDTKAEYVGTIRFSPPKAEENKLKCKEIKQVK